MDNNTSQSDVVKKNANPKKTANQSETLTQEQEDQFLQLEGQITDNLNSALKLAVALAQIREQKLYRQAYNTFEEYCKKRWDYSRSYGLRLADMGGVMDDLKPYQDTEAYPRNESQARIFVSLNKEQRLELAAKVRQDTKHDELTAAVYSEYKEELFPNKSPIKKGTPKKDEPVIDIEATVTQLPELPSLVKLVEFAKGVEKEIMSGKDKKQLSKLLIEFIKEATLVCESSKAQGISD